MQKKKNDIEVKGEEPSKDKIEYKKAEILTIGAHNDDYLIGAGGTLAKYSSEGRKFISIIMSYGVNSHPYMKEKVTTKERVLESQKADKILGGEGVIYLGLKEGSFLKESEETKAILMRIIKENKPKKIFTHTPQDPHPDHQATYKMTMEVLDEIGFKGDVYSFDIWNLINFKKVDKPQLIVDINETFGLKIEAFKAHKSQKMTLISLLWNVYLKAILNGINHGYRYCEVFNKIR